MNNVFSNDNNRKNHFYRQIEKYGKNQEVFIAVAFFTDYAAIKNLIKNNCVVRLIIRLNFGTSYVSLQEIINEKNVYIRFYTSENFHPKLYIFGNQIAFVGSSNLTKSGLETNQEINIGIYPEDERFDELISIFNDYWDSPDIEVLTEDKLKTFKEISDKYSINKFKNDFNSEIKKVLGDNTFSNINRGVTKKKSKENIFVNSFLKRYQVFLKKHKFLESIYQDTGIRVENETDLPLRIEIDQFLSWIRETKAYGDNYLETKLKNDIELKNDIPSIIKEFHDYRINLNGLKETIKHFNDIQEYFQNKEKIDNISNDELFSTIKHIHSFSSRERYLYEDGRSLLKEKFINDNTDLKIRTTIKYLLYGTDNYYERIGKCIYDNNYKLKHFGESGVKELFGWINSENIPICNERTLKSMQWLGFGD